LQILHQARRPRTKKIFSVDILQDTREKMANGYFDKQKKFTDAATQTERPFSQLAPDKKMKVLEDVLAKYVAPILAKDSGGVELADLQENTVFIIFQGACQGCQSGTGATLQMIENILKERIDSSLKVKLIEIKG
jgi:NifU-like protein